MGTNRCPPVNYVYEGKYESISLTRGDYWVIRMKSYPICLDHCSDRTDSITPAIPFSVAFRDIIDFFPIRVFILYQPALIFIILSQLIPKTALPVLVRSPKLSNVSANRCPHGTQRLWRIIGFNFSKCKSHSHAVTTETYEALSDSDCVRLVSDCEL